MYVYDAILAEYLACMMQSSQQSTKLCYHLVICSLLVDWRSGAGWISLLSQMGQCVQQGSSTFFEINELCELLGNSARKAWTRLPRNSETRLGSFRPRARVEPSRVASYSFSSRVSSFSSRPTWHKTNLVFQTFSSIYGTWNRGS